jgi:hypothetical protein
MKREEIERIIQLVLKEHVHEKSTCKDGNCTDGLCVIHNKAGVRNIVDEGACRVSASIGVSAAGGIENELARMIDHTLLKPEATTKQIRSPMCQTVKRYTGKSLHGYRLPPRGNVHRS